MLLLLSGLNSSEGPFLLRLGASIRHLLDFDFAALSFKSLNDLLSTLVQNLWARRHSLHSDFTFLSGQWQLLHQIMADSLCHQGSLLLDLSVLELLVQKVYVEHTCRLACGAQRPFCRESFKMQSGQGSGHLSGPVDWLGGLRSFFLPFTFEQEVL